jgi:hypothetical protein
MHLHEDTMWINSMAGILRIDLNVAWANGTHHEKETPTSTS